MPIHKVRITQVARIERDIVVEVEAETMEAAIEMTEESDAPSLSDKGWRVVRDEVMNEDATPA